MLLDVVGFIAAWLNATELCELRTLNRSYCDTLLHQTWELTVESIRNPLALTKLLPAMFPNVRKLRLQQVALAADPVGYKPLFGSWQLTDVEIHRVSSLSNDHIHVLTQQNPGLQRLVLSECYKVTAPTIIGPNLRCLTVLHCPLRRFSTGSYWPQLKLLHVSSRLLTTLETRHLIKKQLGGTTSQLEVLQLTLCLNIQQVLIDPNELPKLTKLDLTSCTALTRLHVASRSLEELSLFFCMNLEYVILDVPRLPLVDLSHAHNVTHLFLSAASLRVANLRACAQLHLKNMQVSCPAYCRWHLQGTALKLEDLLKIGGDETDDSKGATSERETFLATS